MLKLSIGVFAHNKADCLEQTLTSLFQQNLFLPHSLWPAPDSLQSDSLQVDALEVIVVANGCTDNTVQVATTFGKQFGQAQTIALLDYQVREIAEAGKSNAWNFYVHQFSDPEVNYLILMDADIVLYDRATLANLVKKLEASSEVWVSTSAPLKHVEIQTKLRLWDRIYLKLSQQKKHDSHALCGQLYCGRVEKLREIVMPIGLPVEDGFLRAMILTNGFTTPEVVTRVSQVEGTSHVFEAYTHPLQLIRHEQRLVIGNLINFILFEYFWSHCHPEKNATQIIREKQNQNPHWLREMIRQKMQDRGFWKVPRGLFFRRFRGLFQDSPLQLLFQLPLKLPLRAAAFLFDLVVFLRVNYILRNHTGVGYW